MDATKDRILTRDGGRCRHCRSDACLSIHHINGDFRDNRDDNLITLCGPCDLNAHRTLRARRSALAETMLGEGVAP